MRAKRFFIGVLAGAVICLAALAAVVCVQDPFFVLRGVDEGETAVFDNERYEMAGLIRHQDYSGVVMGTSLVANYRASWFGEGTGETVLKITFPDGWISEFDTALDLAYHTHGELEYVFFCLDPNILVRGEGERTVELPDYLYNENPLDDVKYLFNADTCRYVLEKWVEAGRGQAVSLDEAYTWDGDYVFSWSNALASYIRPEVSRTKLPDDAYAAAAEENLDVICGWIEDHPDTRFVIWFPPYSILYWDKMTREGTADAVLSAVEYACQRLLGYETVSLHSFLDDYDVLENLNYYTDHIHCSGELTHAVTQDVLAGRRQLTEETYLRQLEQLREFVAGYDYEWLFPQPEQGNG